MPARDLNSILEVILNTWMPTRITLPMVTVTTSETIVWILVSRVVTIISAMEIIIMGAIKVVDLEVLVELVVVLVFIMTTNTLTIWSTTWTDSRTRWGWVITVSGVIHSMLVIINYKSRVVNSIISRWGEDRRGYMPMLDTMFRQHRVAIIWIKKQVALLSQGLFRGRQMLI